MKKLKEERLVNRFFWFMWWNKKSKNYQDLYFSLGLTCGFISALFLSDIIDISCYKNMHERISALREYVENRLRDEGGIKMNELI